MSPNQRRAASTEQKPISAAPSISLPKGGGAIRGIGETFAANPVTGTGSMSVPIAVSPGRAGFGPDLSLTYDSGAGNGPFGFGWSLSLPQISRKTDKGLPQYRDREASDVFLLSGAEDLVPVLMEQNGTWSPEALPDRTIDDDTYAVHRYCPRIEGLFARIERWTRHDDGDVHWRSISTDNVLSLYGKDENSRITDPSDSQRIFTWLICETRDDKGNAAFYEYKAEDGTGVELSSAHQRNRGSRDDPRRATNRYIKRICYGNRVPLLDDSGQRPLIVTTEQVGDANWMFEMVFDYGEHAVDAPTPGDSGDWTYRSDPFSSYRSGFEIRTTRLCQRALMFHHFPGEPGVERDCLVQSIDFTYSDEVDPTDIRNPVYSFLRTAIQTGYRRSGGGYDRRSLPPVEFEYTEPIVQDLVEEVDSESLENLPAGLDASSYRWIDLHGEGIPGILSEQAGAWYYKRNLSPIPETLPDGRERVMAKLAPAHTVGLRPNVSVNGAEFLDLAGDGQPDVVIMEGPTPGLYEHDGAGGWHPLRPFTAHLNRNLRDPNVKSVDLDGDGRADLLITEEDGVFVWHASLAEEGFGAARRVALQLDEEHGPRVVFADGTESISLADLSGDGLTDIVRIRNGEVCYWPNLGHGRFGAMVTMDNTPWFDHEDEFDHRRLRLADIDGSGTTDIIYLHRDGVRLYFNQSGNSWSRARSLNVFPRVDDVVSIVPADLLGNGTVCLVWSSPWTGDARRPMRYVNLMGGRKPHLLVRTINNLGTETRVEYAPSTKFYLQDRRAGTPWITRLPFPVHVVERVETVDHVSRNRFVTRYAYHHGYFDGEEREFCGFGMVEQWDTEEIAALTPGGALPASNADAASHVPPVHTKTWFHTGAYFGRDRISDYFAGLLDESDRGEYYREPGLTDAEARARLLSDTVLPAGLSPAEERESCRALRGSMLRQEIYADDADPFASDDHVRRSNTPYTLTEQNFNIRVLQPRGGNRHAVVFAHPRETIEFSYERDASDPRVQQTLTLEVDAYGNVLKEAAVGYGRRTTIRIVDALGHVAQISNPGLAGLEPADRSRQTTSLIAYTENRVSNAVASDGTYRHPLPCETLTFELTGYLPSGADGRFQASDFVESDVNAPGRLRHRFTDEVAYEAAATVNRCRRAIECQRTLYRRDDLNGVLPFGSLEPLGLSGESYRLAFTPGLLRQAFRRPRSGQPDEALLADPALVLSGEAGDRGGYLQSQVLKADGRFPSTDPDDHWWIPSGQSFFAPTLTNAASELTEARQHFFLPRRYRDAFGQEAFVDFDTNDLLLIETRDAVGNRTKVEACDYRVLQPRVVSDPNRNRSETAFDTLGIAVGTAVMGKPSPAPVEGDTLSGFATDPSQSQIDGLFDAADPHAAAAALLQGATTRIVYDVGRYRRSRQTHPDDPAQWRPACIATLTRETDGDAASADGVRVRIGFTYSDGIGREIQMKIQAEPGPLSDGGPVVTPRWVGSGWTIFNNKGKPVRQYEPFFSASHAFQFDVRSGVSAVLFYDPADRAIATLKADHTYDKVVFGPWHQTTYDVNDTCAARNDQTGDPRTDPDVAGYMARYFAALSAAEWQTWHAQRIGGGLGPHQKAAAVRAADHADTPGTAHFDALGRTFLTIARNRVVCTGHDLDGTEERCVTRVELDFESNERAVRDAILQAGNGLGRIVMRSTYDMLGTRICENSMEAGARWMLNDVAGKPLRAWDSRGHNFTTTYDPLRRPLEQTVRGTFVTGEAASDPRTLNVEILTDRIEYGEGLANGEALNLRTRIYRHFDSAGVTTNGRLDAAGNPAAAYDFRGNALHSTRRFVSDYTAIPDWRHSPQLQAETFEGSTRYDALNRPIQLIAPHSHQPHASRNVIQPVFNDAGLLERVDVWLARATEPAAPLDPAVEAPSPVGVASVDYDAKGRRLRIEYKNGAVTRYRYDPETFRLVHLYTRRGPAFTADCDNPQPPPPTIASPEHPLAGTTCGLQNLHYTYDPAGNITHIQDAAQATIYFRNQRIEPDNDYTYDALYRLIQATGREHLGQGGAPIPYSSDDAGRAGLMNGDAAGHFGPDDRDAMAAYVERYVYDAAGNFVRMQHSGTNPAHPRWTRAYDYRAASLIEDGSGGALLKFSNRLTGTTLSPDGANPVDEAYLHDAHGNIVRMPHLGSGLPGPNMQWDFKDQLCRVDLGGGGTAHYVYDSAGQRVRKVWAKAPGLIEERLYLGAVEIFRKHHGPIGANTAVLERETLHVMDDARRVALVETRTLDTGGTDAAPARLIRYQFGNHLGSASLELDEDSQIISYEEYAPYGSSTYQAVRSHTETPKRYRYTGLERDADTGFNTHGARQYILWLGTWLSCDPVGVRGGLNLYRYGNNRPVNAVDATGTQPVDPDLGNVTAYKKQPSAVRSGGARISENEHVVNKAAVQEMTRNPSTGASDYTDRHYRNDDTVRVEREMALNKTHGNRGGAGADNPRARAIKARVRGGGGINYREDVFLPAVDNAHRAARATSSGVTPEQINRAALGQDGKLFALQTATESGAAARRLGGSTPDPEALRFDADVEPESGPAKSSKPANKGGGRGIGRVVGGAGVLGMAGDVAVQLHEGDYSGAVKTVGVGLAIAKTLAKHPALAPLAVMAGTIQAYDDDVKRHANKAGSWVERKTGSRVVGAVAASAVATGESVFQGTFGNVGRGIGKGAAVLYIRATSDDYTLVPWKSEVWSDFWSAPSIFDIARQKMQQRR